MDASAAIALVLAEDEGEEVAELIHDTITINGQIFVPELFWYELGNGLVMAERADRIAPQTITLAGENGLTCYDASYLELALRFQAPLKSYDTHLVSLRGAFPLIL